MGEIQRRLTLGDNELCILSRILMQRDGAISKLIANRRCRWLVMKRRTVIPDAPVTIALRYYNEPSAMRGVRACRSVRKTDTSILRGLAPVRFFWR